MIEYANTTYGLAGKELQRRLGAIAANAVHEARKAHGIDHLPMMDAQWQILEIIRKSLEGMSVNDAHDVPEGSLVSPAQAPRNNALDQILPNFEKALQGIDDPIDVLRSEAQAKRAAKNA